MGTNEFDAIIDAALREDTPEGDVTSESIIPAEARSEAIFLAKEDGVLAGLAIARRVLEKIDPAVEFDEKIQDGAAFRKFDILAAIEGPTMAILKGERTALNFLQHLSGVATATRRFVDAVAGTKAKILDTRKTAPGWRALEKYAVRCGGGANHRAGLYDMILIKDNHIAAAGSITTAIERCRSSRLSKEVETQTLADVEEAIAAGVKRILLDNMTVAQMKRAVNFARGRAKFEASGGVNLRTVRRIAQTGVDYISVGAITHSAPAADIALDFLPD